MPPNRRTRGKSRPKKRHQKRASRRWVRILVWILGLGIATGLVVSLYFMALASRYDLKDVANIPERIAVYDCDGKLFSRLAGENRIVIPSDQVPHNFLNALLAREDTRFYRHIGVDPLGISRALVRNIMHGGIREGGSTITQQLALNTFLGGRHVHSIYRKLLEAFIAFRIEENYSKAEILTHYANRIYFGSGVYGLETASQAYFGIPAADLSLDQAALLAGMIRSPNRFSPFKNLEGSVKQRNSVLNRMAELGMITQAQCDHAREGTPDITHRRPLASQESYAMDAVRNALDEVLTDAQMDEGGLRIHTTIDPRLQDAAQKAVESRLTEIESRTAFTHPTKAAWVSPQDGSPTPYLQASLLAIDPRSGGIRAVIGGRDYHQSRYNRALLTSRQVGSTFKPFVYAAAIFQGMDPERRIDDGPIRAGEIPQSPDWRPGNSDGSYRAAMPAAEGLIQSRNTMTVRVGQIAGIQEVQRVAAQCGLVDLPRQPAIYLGAFEATLMQMVSAYSVFPTGGQRRTPYLIERIEDSDGAVIYRAKKQTLPALSKSVTTSINAMLQEVFEHGTAANAEEYGFKRPAAGKTGTTNDFRDAWFIGYTKSLVAGVWIGFDKPQSIMDKGYGSTLALPVWCDFMNAADQDKYPASPFEGRDRAAKGKTSPGGSPKKGPNFIDKMRKLFGG